jgi:AraC-like DNA-binding protein
MSRSGYARRFAEVFGESPVAFLKRERLCRAAHLLSFTALPVKTVAGRSGFRSRSSFTRAFQKLFGVAPSVLRACALVDDRGAIIRNLDGKAVRFVGATRVVDDS